MITTILVHGEGRESLRFEMRRPEIRVGADSFCDVQLSQRAGAGVTIVVDDASLCFRVSSADSSHETVVARPGGLPRVSAPGELFPAGSTIVLSLDGGGVLELQVVAIESPARAELGVVGRLETDPAPPQDNAVLMPLLGLAFELNALDNFDSICLAFRRYLVVTGLPVHAVAVALPASGTDDDLAVCRLAGRDAEALLPLRLFIPGSEARTMLAAGSVLQRSHGDSTTLLVPSSQGEPLEVVLAIDFTTPEIPWEVVQPLLSVVAPLVRSAITRAKRSEDLAAADDENRYFRVRQRRRDIFKDLVAESPSMRQLHRELNTLVSSSAPVLLRGEAGTGKELLARALHHLGHRGSGLYLAHKCGIHEEHEAEIELFGATRSEANGRTVQRRGVFELAADGTVFLDEVHLLSPSLQARLMRAAAEHEFFRIGESQARVTRARIVAASHHDLLALADEGRFRRDLAVLLGSQTLIVPPLRRRREDFPGLCRAFVRQHARRYRKAITRIDDDCMLWLEQLTWPGNVRELQTVIERAVLQASDEQTTLRRVDFELR